MQYYLFPCVYWGTFGESPYLHLVRKCVLKEFDPFLECSGLVKLSAGFNFFAARSNQRNHNHVLLKSVGNYFSEQKSLSTGQALLLEAYHEPEHASLAEPMTFFMIGGLKDRTTMFKVPVGDQILLFKPQFGCISVDLDTELTSESLGEKIAQYLLNDIPKGKGGTLGSLVIKFRSKDYNHERNAHFSILGIDLQHSQLRSQKSGCYSSL